jgi:beta-lactamase class A
MTSRSMAFALCCLLGWLACGCTSPGTDRAREAALRAEFEAMLSDFEGDAGLYLRRLDGSCEVAIRADETFPTASLVKVPIALALLAKVEAGELDWKAPVAYSKERHSRGGDDLVAKLVDGSKLEPSKLLFLMESVSDNTASVMCQELAGGGAAINAWLGARGWSATRVNSRVAGREAEQKLHGWGQTSPREMAEMLVAIRERRAVSPAADELLDRMLGRAYWDGEALCAIPSDVHAISKQGAVNASRSEVLLVSAPSGPYVLCVITKNQKDMSWEDGNAGFRLLRQASASAWRHMEPTRPHDAPIDGPRWP